MDIAGRQLAALQLMEREGCEVMLVASNELARIDTVFHLTGYRPLGESLAVLSLHDRPTLVVTPEWEVERARARAASWTIRGAEDLPQAVGALFPKGLPAGKVATVGLGKLPGAIGRKLVDFAGASAKKLDQKLEAALAPKTSDE